MRAVRITRRLDSETRYLPELRPLLGKEVEIVVREAEAAPAVDEATAERYPLRGSILRDDDPFEPAVPEEDWEVYPAETSGAPRPSTRGS